MRELLRYLLSPPQQGMGEGLENAVTHSWQLGGGATFLLIVLSIGFPIFVYLRERSEAGTGIRMLLASIRSLLLGLVLFMMYGWMWSQHKTDLPDLVLAIDVSASMRIEDHYEDETVIAAVKEWLDAGGFAESNRLSQALSLLVADDGILEDLENRYHLRFYTVGSAAKALNEDDAKTAELLPTLKTLEANDANSRLGSGIRDVIEAQRGRPTAAIVVLTDGITTGGKPLSVAAGYAKRKGIPLFLVGLGNQNSPRDIRVSELLVEKSVYAGDLVNFDFKVTSDGFADKELVVRLRQEGKSEVLAETKVQGPDGVPQAVRLSHRPQEKGEFTFVVEIEQQEGEVNGENNSVAEVVNVRDETIRVLAVQEYPNYDFRFLKQLFARAAKGKDTEAEKAIQLTTVLQEADLQNAQQDDSAVRVFPVSREELFKFDVLILGDTNPSLLSRTVQSNIAAFVKERGGGLVMLAGPRHMPLAFRDTPLAELVPIDLSTATLPTPGTLLDVAYRVRPTRMGLSTPPMQISDSPAENAQAWNELPELYWLLEGDSLPAARVLAEHPGRTGANGEPLPVICLQFVGSGKVVFHATDESWRWSRLEATENYYARYWLQMIRYLSRSKLLGQSRQAELVSDRESYRRGEQAQLRVRFFDDRLAPAQDDGVTVMVEREGGRRRTVTLTRVATARGMFEGELTELPEGQYRAWVANPSLEGAPATRFVVRAPPGEQAQVEMNDKELRQAAKLTSGRFFTIDSADELSDELPQGRQVRIESLPPVPLWNSPILALLFVALISAEWLLRKQYGML